MGNLCSKPSAEIFNREQVELNIKREQEELYRKREQEELYRKREQEELYRKREGRIQERILSGVVLDHERFECRRPTVEKYNEVMNVEIESTFNESFVEGQDQMIKVENTRVWPYCAHGRFTAEVPNATPKGSGTLMGSGTMIRPNMVLTCASNVYLRSWNLQLDKVEMRFYPGMNGTHTPYGSARIKEVYFPEEYKSNQNEDYALLILDDDIGKYTGYFGIYEGLKENLSNKASLHGYPSEMHTLWGMEGFLEIDEDEDVIHHEIYSTEGQSGSPLYQYIDEGFYIFGVHVRGLNEKNSSNKNQAVFLNNTRIERIRAWIKDYHIKQGLMRKIDLSDCFDIYETVIDKLDLECLEELRLSSCIVNLSILTKLSQAKLTELNSLYLSSNQIADSGAHALSQANFPNLIILDLSSNQIADSGAHALSQANFPNLNSLDLSSNQIGDSGAGGLSLAKFPNLNNLDLSSNRIGDSGATQLSQGNFPHLSYLLLSSNQIGDSGATQLSLANFPHLYYLVLSSNQIGDLGARALSQANFPHLNFLVLSSNKI